MLLIPAAQRAAAARPGSNPRLVIVGSDIHYFADMPKKVINAPSGKVLHELNKSENFLKAMGQQPRYNQSKRAFSSTYLYTTYLELIGDCNSSYHSSPHPRARKASRGHAIDSRLRKPRLLQVCSPS